VCLIFPVAVFALKECRNQKRKLVYRFDIQSIYRILFDNLSRLIRDLNGLNFNSIGSLLTNLFKISSTKNCTTVSNIVFDYIHPVDLSWGPSKIEHIYNTKNLELHTLWYLQIHSSGNTYFPSIISENNHKYRYTYNNTENSLVIAFRFLDLSSTIIKLNWQTVAPFEVFIQQRHTKPPIELSQSLLLKAHKMYSHHIIKFCSDNWDKQVGNGECWSLAYEALKSIEGCFFSQRFVHGCLVYSSKPGSFNDRPRKGDIIQYRNCKFAGKWGSSKIGIPDHTAILISIIGDKITVAEQNMGGINRVRKGKIILSELVDGELQIYRPIWKTWVGELIPIW
jgi:hypothetical protein